MKIYKNLLYVFVLILPLFLVTNAYSQEKAPDFELENIKGGKLKLSDYKGKVVILDFWDTWCPPCREEIPDFVELYKKYNENVVIIGAAFAQRGKKAVEDFYKEYKMNYPVVIATQATARDFGGIRGIPTTFVIAQVAHASAK